MSVVAAPSPTVAVAVPSSAPSMVTVSATAQKAIQALDLSMVRMKLMDHEEGEGWSAEYADKLIAEYRKFLLLTKTYPHLGIVPAKLVDKVWHHHILDTHAYAPDCQSVFGHFMHHFPYWGMRGEEDKAELYSAYAATLQLYEQHFGAPESEIWEGPARCPNCGRR